MPLPALQTGTVDVCPPPPEPVLWDEAWGENPFARKEPPDPLLLISDWAGSEPWREVEALLLEDALVMEDGETGRVGWPREVTLPGLPQIRTCAISASGSSDQGFAARRRRECTAMGGGRG